MARNKLLFHLPSIPPSLPPRVDASKMGLVCSVAFMGAPVIILEKLVGGEEAALAFTRLQQVIASGACEGDGKMATKEVRVQEKTCEYFDGTSFPVYIASSDDLDAVPLDNLPLVSRDVGSRKVEKEGVGPRILLG